MTRINDKQLFTLALLAFAAVILYATAGLSEVGRLVPLSVLIPTLVLLLVQLCLDLAPGFAQKHPLLEQKDVFGIEQMRLIASEEAANSVTSRGRRELSVFAWVAFVPAVMYLLGSLIALPLFLLLYLKVRSKEGWVLSVGMAVAMFGFLYGVFVAVLSVRLHEGWLWNRLGP